MSNLTLPEAFKIVQGHEPAAANAVIDTGDTISCKNLKKLWVILHHYSGGGDTDLVVTWYESTDVAFGTTSQITETCPIWYNTDTSAGDTLTRATDAYTFTVDTGAGKDQIWIMEWDPAKHSAGYDCFHITTSGGNASNIFNFLFIGELRYQSDGPPTIITD